MSMLKMLFSLATGMGAQGKVSRTATNWFVRFVQASVREEILFFLFRLTAGLALAATMSFSLIIVAQTIIDQLMTMENGPAWVVVIFLLVAVLCGVGIFLLFFKGRRGLEESRGRQEVLPINVRKIAIAFVDGLMEGAATTQKARVTDSVSSWP